MTVKHTQKNFHQKQKTILMKELIWKTNLKILKNYLSWTKFKKLDISQSENKLNNLRNDEYVVKQSQEKQCSPANLEKIINIEEIAILEVPTWKNSSYRNVECRVIK